MWFEVSPIHWWPLFGSSQKCLWCHSTSSVSDPGPERPILILTCSSSKEAFSTTEGALTLGASNAPLLLSQVDLYTGCVAAPSWFYSQEHSQLQQQSEVLLASTGMVNLAFPTQGERVDPCAPTRYQGRGEVLSTYFAVHGSGRRAGLSASFRPADRSFSMLRRQPKYL